MLQHLFLCSLYVWLAGINMPQHLFYMNYMRVLHPYTADLRQSHGLTWFTAISLAVLQHLSSTPGQQSCKKPNKTHQHISASLTNQKLVDRTTVCSGAFCCIRWLHPTLRSPETYYCMACGLWWGNTIIWTIFKEITVSWPVQGWPGSDGQNNHLNSFLENHSLACSDEWLRNFILPMFVKILRTLFLCCKKQQCFVKL